MAALTYAGDPQGKAPHVGAFTLKRVITRYKPDGTQAVTREIYRRASDGSFRIVETDGQRILLDRGFSQGRGFFRVDYANKTLWRDTTQQPDRGPMPADPAIFTKSEFYVGTDAVLGRTAYHLRVPGRREGIIDQEHWYFAETGPVPVRGLYYRADGSLEIEAEPYSLDFDEPDPVLVRLPAFKEADAAASQ